MTTEKNKSLSLQTYEAEQLFVSTNVSRAANQNIRMISEGSCDTEVMTLKIQLAITEMCIQNKNCYFKL